jgi:hypothetical protein
MRIRVGNGVEQLHLQYNSEHFCDLKFVVYYENAWLRLKMGFLYRSYLAGQFIKDICHVADYSTRSESLLRPMFTTHPLGVLVK